MSQVRAIDANGDWTFGNGLQSYKSDIDALKQSILTRLRCWVSNCYFDSANGVDWNNLLDIGTKTLLDLDIKRVILQTGGVLKIDTYESTLDQDSRAVTISAIIDSIYGQLTYEETI